MDPSGNEPLIAPVDQRYGGECRTYKSRWYVLFVYALLCFMSGLISNTWSPISHASEIAFRWSDSDIALITNWQPVIFLLSVPAMAWVIDEKGLRVSCLLSAVFYVVGCGLRCVTAVPPASTWLYHSGQIISSLGSPVVFAAPSVVSNTWFPPSQRTTATGFSTIGNGIGLALGYILGPLIVTVPDLPGTPTNVSTMASKTPYDGNVIDSIRSQIMTVMDVQMFLSVVTFLLLFVYFPARPPSPPSLVAVADRLSFSTGLKQLLKLPKFWVLAFVYAATNGVYSGLSAVLDVDLKATGVEDDQLVAGWLGFGSYIACALGCLVVSAIADYFAGAIKILLISICALATGVFVWFSLIVEGIAPASIATLSLTFVTGSVLLNAAVPVFYELACDATYPLGEGLTNGMLNVVNNIAMVLFLLILSIPRIGTSWMNWVLVGSVAICVPLLIPFIPAPQRQERTQHGATKGPDLSLCQDNITTPNILQQ